MTKTAPRSVQPVFKRSFGKSVVYDSASSILTCRDLERLVLAMNVSYEEDMLLAASLLCDLALVDEIKAIMVDDNRYCCS